ncbi:MAG: hypothetical protein ACE5FS_02665 [Paracoccaceae bacterium]
MKSKDKAGGRQPSGRPESARALLEDLVFALSEAVNELRENPRSTKDAKARHDLIQKNIRSLHLLMEVERKLEEKINKGSGNPAGQELDLRQASEEIRKRLARIVAAEKD